MSQHPTRSRSTVRLLTAVLLGIALSALGLATSVTSASADDKSGSTDSGTGWIRLTHLSPDTPSVDVRLTSLSDSSSMVKLSDVSYGDVSAYEKVPAGRYVAAMTPAGGNSDSRPVITQQVTVQKDYAYTVAAIGKNADLKGLVLNDDLRSPKAGEAKIRLIQASTNAPTVTVTAMGGPVLARNASFGSTTGYASVQAGVWTVDLAPGAGSSAAPTSLKVTATPGSVNTIVLLNRGDGQVAGTVLKDAGGTMKMPTKGKGVNTGGGGAATQFASESAPTAVATVGVGSAVSAGLLIMAGVVWVALTGRPLAARVSARRRRGAAG